MEQCPQQLINMKFFLHIFLMVGASKANMLTDQLDKTNNYCFFAKCHVIDMKVMGPSNKALKHKQLVTLGVGMDDKAVHVTTESP